jgi:hypothetical protein
MVKLVRLGMNNNTCSNIVQVIIDRLTARNTGEIFKLLNIVLPNNYPETLLRKKGPDKNITAPHFAVIQKTTSRYDSKSSLES